MITAARKAEAAAERKPALSISLWPRRIVIAALILYCGLGSAFVLYDSVRLVPVQYETTYPESANAYLAVLSVRTGKLYHSFSAEPYLVQAYGPLFYAANAVIARATKLDIDATVLWGRTLSLGCFLLCGAVVFEISRKLGFRNSHSFLAGTMLLAQPAFIFWNATMRPDVPALLGMLLSIFFVVQQEQPANSELALSGVAAGFAFLFKQSAIAAPVAIALVLVFRRKFREILLLALAAAAPVVVVFAILLWRRETFLPHFFALTTATWSAKAAARWFLTPRALSMLPIPLAIGMAGFAGAASGDQRAKMIAAFAVVAWLEAIATMAQMGADLNYFLPALAGCALLLPFAMHLVTEKARTSRAAAILVIALLGGSAVDAAVCNRYRPLGEQTKISFQALDSLSVLSDDPYLAMHAAGPGMLDPFTAHDFELRGRWNAAPVVKKIRGGEYDLVIMTAGRIIPSYRGISYFGAPIVDALNRNYEVLCTAGAAIVLKPRYRDIPIAAENLSGMLGPCAPPARATAPGLRLAKSAH